ncbi:MAG: class I SAM-dependent methyltransferase [Rhizonema sp. PD37]|nr:class I SAM-dependent methyltransferase [Rhizonema sp. PD37]
MTNYQVKPNYGIDAPEVIRQFLLIGFISAIAGWFTPPLSIFGNTFSFIGSVLFTLGLLAIALGTSMIAYGIRGKFNIREQMLNIVNWKGDENVLDIGTGRGLLMIGAAKRLKTGKVIGIDIWNTEDLSGNTAGNTLINVELEGVKDKTELKNEDVRNMSFADNSFVVILSLLCLHNIDDKTEREVACREIARVLKPGGTAVISDYVNISEYAKVLAQVGLKVEKPKSYFFEAYSLIWMVVVTKER